MNCGETLQNLNSTLPPYFEFADHPLFIWQVLIISTFSPIQIESMKPVFEVVKRVLQLTVVHL